MRRANGALRAPDPHGAHLLIIEDDRDLSSGLRDNFEIEGYDVTVAEDGRTGLDAARGSAPDLVILDLMLPELDGFRVLRELRDGGSRVPVVVLTARGQEMDKVRAFRLGADDYVTKPFGILELLARAEAVLRRSRATDGDARETYVFGDVAVDVAARAVVLRGAPVSLAPLEFDLLLALARRGGDVATRRELLEEVWGYDAAVQSRTVDAHITALRRKLEDDPAIPRYILTSRKIGYRMRP
ncbi:MAG TPA: response regulator transcription factor [Gemmatimonadaceae bacterium]|nr:response regulator transcription factor [Gemmatimonadaceae bacterium]